MSMQPRSCSADTRSRLTHIYQDLIKLFKRECEELVNIFKNQCSENFQDFIPIWKSRKFHVIYEKYAKDGVLHLLKEDSLLIAKNIMFNDHFLGGLFLLYGLYFIQEDPSSRHRSATGRSSRDGTNWIHQIPRLVSQLADDFFLSICSPFAETVTVFEIRSFIRIEYDEFLHLLQLIKVERNNTIETCQPGFMFAKLLKNNAFAFVRFGQEFSMEGQYRSRIVHGHKSNVDSTLNGSSGNPNDWLRTFLQNVDFLDELKEVDENYFKKKQELKNSHPELNLALDLVPDDLVGGLKEALCTVDNDSSSSIDIGNPQCATDTRCDPFPDPIPSGATRRKLISNQCKKRTKYWNKKANASNVMGTAKSSVCIKKKKGCPKGLRKSYFKTVVNDPEPEVDGDILPFSSDVVLAMPDI